MISKAKQDAATMAASAEQDAELAKTNADLKVAESKLKIDNLNKLQATHQKTLDSISRQTAEAKAALDAATQPAASSVEPIVNEPSDAPPAPASQPVAPQLELSAP